MRLGGEKPHQGLPGRNPALYQGPTVCNSTTALGLREQAELNRVGSCSTGKEHDAESGNEYFDARYLSSTLGRFLTPDWAAKPTSVPYASFGDPQTLNLYSYVENGPLNRVDADGHANAKLPIGYESIDDFANPSCGPHYSGGDPCWASNQGLSEAIDEANYLAQVQQASASTGNTAAQPAQQELSKKSEDAIENSALNGEQAGAFERAVKAAGSADGINPNDFVGIAMNESSLNPSAQNPTSSAAGLFGLTDNIKSAYGLSASDATGSSPSAITNQVNAAAGYLHDLMKGPIPSGHPDHQFEIALGYFRGTRKSVNKAIGSKGGYNSMLKLRFGGESLKHYIGKVESYE